MNSQDPLKTDSVAANGHTQKPSLISALLSQLVDLIDLAALEARYELEGAARKMLAFGAALVLAITAFALLQVCLVRALMHFGLSLGISSLLLAVAYGGLAGVLGYSVARRDAAVGSPFQGTLRETKETVRWIQKIF